MSPSYATEETLRTLEAARELVAQPGGWCQGHYSANGKVCAVGALRYVAADETRVQAAQIALCHALGFGGVSGITDWNDSFRRTQAEVVGGFDRTITHVRQSLATAAAPATEGAPQ